MPKVPDFIYKDSKIKVEPQPSFNGTDLNGKPYFIYEGREHSLWGLSKLGIIIVKKPELRRRKMNYNKVIKLLNEPITCEDGKTHRIDGSVKRNLAYQICQLFELKSYPTKDIRMLTSYLGSLYGRLDGERDIAEIKAIAYTIGILNELSNEPKPLLDVKPEGCPNKACRQESRDTCYNCGYYDFEPCQPKPTYALTCDCCGRAFSSPDAFPTPQLCPKCSKPNASESGLLTGTERVEVWEKYETEHPNPELIIDSDFGYVQRLLKAQLAKDIEYEQQRVERLKKEIEDEFPFDLPKHQSLKDLPWWQAIWKREGIDDNTKNNEGQ